METDMTPSAAAEPVAHELRGNVLLVTIDNPPVNALGVAVRRGLVAAVDAAEANPAVRAVLIVGAGRNFIAGADIREFGKPPQAPSLPDVCNRIEACNRPIVVAIHGAALGGGLEIALASHYRLAVAGAKLGLPEVKLGLLPGAGGTQRTPRLVGVEAALSLILSGKHIDAHEALQLGLVDKLGQSDDVLAEGLAYAQQLLTEHAPPRRTRDAQALADKAASIAAIAAARTDTAKKARGLLSPMKIVDCVEAALNLPFDEGLRFERALSRMPRQPAARGSRACVQRRTRSAESARNAQRASAARARGGRGRRRHDGGGYRRIAARRGLAGDDDRTR
jgi:3-hydroxyacyl-CoA dehydrogenase